MRFVVGVNVPWIACGHDFGPRPPAWAGAGRTDWAAFEVSLRGLADLGLRVARVWVLAGGVNLPVGGSPDDQARRVPLVEPWSRRARSRRRRRGGPERWDWFATPRLPSAFLEDFDAMLRAARSARIQLVPSLLSFEFFEPLRVGPKGVPDRGHADLALRPDFFEHLLEPLLDVAEQRADALAAFEIMNEPDWVVRPGHDAVHGAHPPWVSPGRMARFLVDGVRRVARRGLRATIGFADGRVPWLPPSARVALQRLARSGRYVHQHHHYPRPGGMETLPDAASLPIGPAWVGEMATTRHRVWRDLDADEGSDAFLEARLRLVRTRGYEAALLWSCSASDAQTDWSEAVQAQARRVAVADGPE